jgi:hypothetical protein
MAFVYDHTAAVIEEAMYNEHNYEFTSMMFTLATSKGGETIPRDWEQGTQVCIL